MKKCPKCLNIYDDSWDTCLQCGDKLFPADKIDLNKYKKDDKIIQKCDKCGKELSGPQVIKYISGFSKAKGGCIYKRVCKICGEEIVIKMYLTAFFTISVFAIPLLLLIIVCIFDKNLFNKMLSLFRR